MNRLQAALRDKAAKGRVERSVAYKVGGYFKGCANCGELEERDDDKERYLSGYQVYRSYVPARTKWTYKCWECGARDLRCWSGAIDIGLDAIRGTREAIARGKKRLRQRIEAENKELTTQDEAVQRTGLIMQIQDLEERIKRLLEKGEQHVKK